MYGPERKMPRVGAGPKVGAQIFRRQRRWSKADGHHGMEQMVSASDHRWLVPDSAHGEVIRMIRSVQN